MRQLFPGTILYGGDYNPEQWSEDVWLEDMRLMKLAHVNMVSVNIFSWAALEPEPGDYHFDKLDRIMDMLATHGIAVDLATATASPPTWMSRLYPSMLPVMRDGTRMSHGSRQHYCPNSPDFRRKSAELVQRLAERYVTHPALKMWHINNEYGCHTSQCYCDNCAAAFRTWLQERYHSLEALNDAWGTNFWSQRYYHWEDILPPRISPAQNNPGQCLDYWRFISDSLLGCYRIEEDILRKVTPQVPLTTNFMPPSFKPLDQFAWASHLDIAAFDMYPPNTAAISEVAFPHEILRSLKGGQPYIVMEQSPSQVNWMPQNPHKRPGRMRLHSMQAVAHGADGVMFFQWRQSQAGAEKFHSAVVSHEGSEHTRIFQQAAQVGAELERLAPTVAGSRISAQTAILMDWSNWWAVEYQPGPSDRLHYWQQLNAYYQALHSLNVAVDVVLPDSDLSNYRLVIAPLLYLLRPGAAKNLERFVERGDILLVTFFSGIVDENDHVVLGGYPGELRKLLGIHMEEFDPWTPEMTNRLVIKEGALQGSYLCTLWGELVRLEGAQALGVFASDYYANGPALTVNQFGQGRAYYIATQGSDELLLKLTRELCHEANVAPVLEAPGGVEVTKRVRADGRAIYFLLNHTEQVQRVALPAGKYTSLLDGRQVAGEVEIGPVDALVVLGE
ncbi:MAG: beta-galactosidase [Chloroflexi bacterium]|nr:beta-galactosidase [Chloroflexota bacterium]